MKVSDFMSWKAVIITALLAILLTILVILHKLEITGYISMITLIAGYFYGKAVGIGKGKENG